MSNDGLIIEYMDLSHIHLAVPNDFAFNFLIQFQTFFELNNLERKNLGNSWLISTKKF